MSRVFRGILSLGVMLMVLYAVGSGSAASAATPVYDGLPLQQYYVNQYPILAVTDFIGQNPNYWHEQDQGIPDWGLSGDVPGHVGTPQVRYDNCTNWPNRLCDYWAEYQLNDSASITGPHGEQCSYTGSPVLLGYTCKFGEYHNGYPVGIECATRVDVDGRSYSNAVRVQASTHEMGHCIGFTHDTQGTAIMEPTINGDFYTPTSSERDAAYKLYHGNPYAYPGCSGCASSAPGTAPEPTDSPDVSVIHRALPHGLPDGTPFTVSHEDNLNGHGKITVRVGSGPNAKSYSAAD